MDAWWAPTVAVAVVAAGLAGCTGADAHAGTLTALEALAKARERFPDLELFALRGLEGARPGPESEYLGLEDDDLDDGALGDGRLSSWVVSFIAEDKESLLEVRVFADDGVQPQLRSHDVPLSALDDQVFLRRAPTQVDSDEAVTAARADATFQGQVAEAPQAGYLYTFSRHGVDYTAPDQRAQDVDQLGWPVSNATWRILHFAVDGVQPLAAATVLDDGTVRDVEVDTPRHVAVLADNAVGLPDPIPPSTTPTVHEFEFTVPVQAQELMGSVFVPSFTNSEYKVRVLSPDGSVIFDSEEPGSTEGTFMVFQPAPGQWKVQAEHTIPVSYPTILILGPPQMHVEAQAEVPLLL